MENKITTKWEKTHLLDELDDFNKNECASSLEEVANLLLNDMNEYMKEVNSKTENGYLAGTILPIVRRLYNEIPEKIPGISMKWLIEDFGEYAKRNYFMFKELEKLHKVDGEAEMCALYTQHVENRV